MLPISPVLNRSTVIDLNTLSHNKARTLVACEAPVFLLVNPVEYHGPHLPLYNDFILSFAASRDLHARLMAREESRHDWPFILAAPLHMGVDPVPGHGSVPFTYHQVRQGVLRACVGLEAMGVKTVFLMTFHGAPLHAMALQAGVRYLNARGIRAIAPFNLLLHEMLNYVPGKFDMALEPLRDEVMREHISKNLYKDFHGGFFETSVALHYAPDTVDPEYKKLPPCPEISPNPVFSATARIAARLGWSRFAAECRFAAYGLGWLKLNPLPGYTGWPHLASAATGKAFAEVLMHHYVEAAEALLDSRAPLTRATSHSEPIMKWIRPLSLGGRI